MGKGRARLSGGDLGIYTTNETSNQLFRESFRDDLLREEKCKLKVGKSLVAKYLFWGNNKKKTNDFIRSVLANSKRWPKEKRESIKNSIYRMDFCRNTVRLDITGIVTFNPAFVIDRNVLLLKDLDKDYITYLYGQDDLKVATVPRGHLSKEEYQKTVEIIDEDIEVQERNHKLHMILSVFTYADILHISHFFLGYEEWKKSSPTILEYVKG